MTEPATAISIASTEAVSAQQTDVTVVTDEPGLRSVELVDAAASGPIHEISYDLS